MKTIDCCNKWAHDCVNYYIHDDMDKIKDIKYFATNVKAISNKLYSFSTPICIFQNGEFLFSRKKYSISTSKHQSYMRQCIIKQSCLHPNDIVCHSVYDINNREEEQ